MLDQAGGRALEESTRRTTNSTLADAVFAINRGIDAILATDRAFDGIDGLKWIDPADERAVATLVG